MYIGSEAAYPLFLSGFNKTLIFARVSKDSQIPNFMKIRPCGRTDMTKLIVAFRNFANALKMHVRLQIYRHDKEKTSPTRKTKGGHDRL